MKIIKREFAWPVATINIWFIPTLTYTMQKVGNTQFNEFEWLWWVAIPSMFVLWFVINFKIKK